MISFPRFIQTITAPARLLFTGLAALTLVLFATVGPAMAHDELTTSSPSQGQVLEKAPETLELTFSGNILNLGHEIRVTDSTGRDVTRGTMVVKDKTVSQPLNDGGTADETYTVTWRVVSQDGHPIEGKYSYSVGNGAAKSANADSAATTQPSSAAQDGAYPPRPSNTPPAEDQDAAMPGWMIAVVGGVAALAVLCVVIMVVTRPKKR